MKVCFESDKTSFLSTVLWKLRKNNINCHTLTILLYHLFTENNKIMEWEKRRFFVKTPALPYQVISKEVENRIFRHNHTFRQICMCTTHIDNNVVELYFCANIYSYFRYIGGLLDDFLVAHCNIIRASWETKKERLSPKKKYIEKFLSMTFFLTVRPFSYVIFRRFFRLLRLYIEKKYFCSIKSWWWGMEGGWDPLLPHSVYGRL